MKLQYLLIVLVFFLQILACKNTIREPTPDKIFNINADNNKSQIDLKLSDLADSFRLIPLETNKECLLDNRTDYYIGKSYIIAFSEKGVYKFSSDGKFIKKLFGLGRGPDEFSNLITCIFTVDEKKDLLYIYDQVRRGKYLIYDLKSEHFLEPVKQCFPGFGTFAIYNDSLIIGSHYSFSDTSNYAVYYQNLKGKLVSGIIHNKRLLTKKGEIAQPGILSRADSIYYYNFRYDDTLFKIKENKLIPYLALNFSTPRKNPPNQIEKKGDRFIYFQIGAPSFIIIQIYIIGDKRARSSEDLKNTDTKCYYLLFNNFNGEASRINSFIDNFIGDTLDALKLSKVDYNSSHLGFLTILPNKKLFISYNPYQIKKAVEKGLDYKNFQDILNKQLLKINETLDETDNPVLLVGDIKKKL